MVLPLRLLDAMPSFAFALELCDLLLLPIPIGVLLLLLMFAALLKGLWFRNCELVLTCCNAAMVLSD